MHITKRQSRVLSVAILIGFIGIGIAFWRSNIPEYEYGTATSTEEKQTDKVAKEPTATAPRAAAIIPPDADSKFTLERFHRSETKDGQTLWEISGSEAEYFPEQNAILIHDCFLLFFTEDQKKIELEAKTARLVIEESRPVRVQAEGDVELRYNDEVTIKTERANYTAKDNLLTSPGKVHIIGEGFSTEGYRMRVRLDREEFRLLRDIKTVIDPSKSSGKDL